MYEFRFDLVNTEGSRNPKYHSYHRVHLVKDYCLKYFSEPSFRTSQLQARIFLLSFEIAESPRHILFLAPCHRGLAFLGAVTKAQT